MSQWNRVLHDLDKIYSHGARGRSRIVKRLRSFDNKTGEHVVRFEYRIRLLNESSLFPLLQALDVLIKEAAMADEWNHDEHERG